jgi:hypothetical protein
MQFSYSPEKFTMFSGTTAQQNRQQKFLEALDAATRTG